MTKFGAKFHSETMDYAGKDLSEAGVKTVDVASPVVNRAADSFSPAIAKVTDAVKNSSSKIYCKHCGKPIEKDSKFCKFCGKEQ
jgi:rRNA maturation endonuclease Nob1